MNILLLGANGQLGRSFVEHGGLATRGRLISATRDGRRFDGGPAEIADMSEPGTLSALLDKVKPALIVNAAAYTAVDRAESEESLATHINGTAVAELGKWAAVHDALLIHYSTDYVFDGSACIPYRTDSPTAPLGAYGRSKLAGERALLGSNAAFLLLRTAWVYASHGQNFLRTMLRLGGERDELRVVADQLGAPTSTDLIVHATLAALDRWISSAPAERVALTGIHHLVASGHTSWHGFASAIFEEATARGLLPRAPVVHQISTEQFPTPARRPLWSVLDNSGFQQCFGYALPDWRGGLQDVMNKLSEQVR